MFWLTFILFLFCSVVILLLFYCYPTAVVLLFYCCSATILLLFYYYSTTILLLFYYYSTVILLFDCERSHCLNLNMSYRQYLRHNHVIYTVIYNCFTSVYRKNLSASFVSPHCLHKDHILRLIRSKPKSSKSTTKTCRWKLWQKVEESPRDTLLSSITWICALINSVGHQKQGLIIFNIIITEKRGTTKKLNSLRKVQLFFLCSA